MTDKEYIRRYADAADRAKRQAQPCDVPAFPARLKRNPLIKRYMDEFLRRHKWLAEGLAKANTGNMPAQPAARAKAMKRSIDKVRDGAGVLHAQPKA